MRGRLTAVPVGRDKVFLDFMECMFTELILELAEDRLRRGLCLYGAMVALKTEGRCDAFCWSAVSTSYTPHKCTEY